MKNLLKKRGKLKKINGIEFMQFMGPKKIQKRIKKLASQIAHDYRDCIEPPILLFTLKGGMYFGVLLSMALDSIGFLHNTQTIKICRYSGDSKSESVSDEEKNMLKEYCKKFSGKDVIVVDDIFDEGITLQTVSDNLVDVAKSVAFAVLVEKDKTRAESVKVKVDYAIISGVHADFWVVGTGMDSEGLLRGIKGLWIKVTDLVKSLYNIK